MSATTLLFVRLQSRKRRSLNNEEKCALRFIAQTLQLRDFFYQHLDANQFAIHEHHEQQFNTTGYA